MKFTISSFFLIFLLVAISPVISAQSNGSPLHLDWGFGIDYSYLSTSILAYPSVSKILLDLNCLYAGNVFARICIDSLPNLFCQINVFYSGLRFETGNDDFYFNFAIVDTLSFGYAMAIADDQFFSVSASVSTLFSQLYSTSPNVLEMQHMIDGLGFIVEYDYAGDVPYFLEISARYFFGQFLWAALFSRVFATDYYFPSGGYFILTISIGFII